MPSKSYAQVPYLDLESHLGKASSLLCYCGVMKVGLGVIAVNQSPWAMIQSEAQMPLFLGQSDPEVEPFWLLGRKGTQFEEDVLSKMDSRLSRDAIFQHMSRFLGFRPLGHRPGRASHIVTSLIGDYSSSRVLRVGQELHFDLPDSFATLGIKTLWFLRYLLECGEYTHFFRTNISSYVDFRRLSAFVRTSPESLDYAGVNVNMGRINIASGAGILLTKESAERVVADSNNWNHGFMDDVALGVLLSRLGYPPPVGLPRLDFNPKKEIPGEVESSCSSANSNFHWRCKSEDPMLTVKRMRELSKMLSHNEA